MPCEHYKDALNEVAAAGAAPSGELRAHLGDCAVCRAAFEEEKSLFATIDSRLHDAINAEVPASLLPRVRAELDEVPARRLPWVKSLVFASAFVALLVLVFLKARTNHSTSENALKSPVVVPVAGASGASTNPEKVSPADALVASVRAAHSRGSENSTTPRSVASSNPEVLVPLDEREAYSRFVAALKEGSGVVVTVPDAPAKNGALASADSLRIPDVEIKPLEGTEVEASDGVSEKR